MFIYFKNSKIESNITILISGDSGLLINQNFILSDVLSRKSEPITGKKPLDGSSSSIHSAAITSSTSTDTANIRFLQNGALSKASRAPVLHKFIGNG
jgi:hypothetical protein